MLERLQEWQGQHVQIVTSSHHVGYAVYKGDLTRIGDDYVELDAGSKTILIALSSILSVTIRT
jgi:ribosome maturation factor RimP